MIEEKQSLLDKLEQMQSRFDELQSQIEDPEIASDHNKMIALAKEQGTLKKIVALYQQYNQTRARIDEAEGILADDSADEEFTELARTELQQLGPEREKLYEQLQDTLVMADDEAIHSVIVEIRPGTGGEEAAIFVRDLYNMYAKYAETRGWKMEVLTFRDSDHGGFREVIFNLNGHGVWAELGYESGAHRVQRVPDTESQGRVHTSAATVAVLPEPEELDIEIDPADVAEHVSRSGGPGGQSVNKLNSAIKLEHIPTGITVSMRDEKSQHKNRSKAWRILKSRIYEHFESQRRNERDSQRKSLIGSGDRSQKIRTYNFPQNRMTDHRINLSLYSLDKIMAGGMEEVVAALQEHDKQQRLENL